MKLPGNLKLVIGHKTWKSEIPDDVFAEITKDWPQAKIDEFRKRFEEKNIPEKKKAVKKSDGGEVK